ncbi:porin [Bacteriovorax sp. Seq25_V]|uniref:porin n=1 Tax=Bacteriovorax sp. Seq25_V TaxID=1201288 RepID=UPI00038A00B3|nr:porin [Bacteriovorax sp. Seq25_V]EQC44268.1 general bacterial porin family protein [Bacteriovorax sp. Seq25_V]
MKKQIAVLAVLATPLASAMEMKMPTVYGKINKAYVNVDQEQNVAKTRNDKSNAGIVEVLNSVSRVGVKGSESVDGGITASYKLELGLDSTNDSVALRNAEVSLKHSYGTLLIGQTYNPFSVVGLGADPMASNIAGHQGADMAQYVAQASSLKTNLGTQGIGFTYRGRVDGATYTTPELMGFTYTISQDKDGKNERETNTENHTEHLLSYKRAISGLDLNLYAGMGSWSQTGTKDNKEMLYGLGLTKNAFKFNAALSSSETKNVGNTFSYEIERTFVAASYSMDKHNIALTYQTREDKNFDNTKDSKYKTTQMAVGYKHQCTKNIDLNLTYAKLEIENETTGATSDDKKNNGNDATLIAAGIQLKF